MKWDKASLLHGLTQTLQALSKAPLACLLSASKNRPRERHTDAEFPSASASQSPLLQASKKQHKTRKD